MAPIGTAQQTGNGEGKSQDISDLNICYWNNQADVHGAAQ
jgi:hypothetical protein